VQRVKTVLPDPKAETKIDIVDCILLAKGAAHDTEVFSFDADLRVKPT